MPVVAVALAGALGLPVLAGAAPNTYAVETTLQPGAKVALQVGKFPRTGEFSFRLRLSSDDAKLFKLTQRRVGGAPFTVLEATASSTPDACEGAAGSLFCTGVTTPETPANSRWRFVLRNTSVRPMLVDLRITWRPVNGE